MPTEIMRTRGITRLESSNPTGPALCLCNRTQQVSENESILAFNLFAVPSFFGHFLASRIEGGVPSFLLTIHNVRAKFIEGAQL
uniref:Uncharacterized protein n=1 Tax=Rhizophora mucronata TaxID=61149 RepID=A0A2P2KWM6_RHIMU